MTVPAIVRTALNPDGGVHCPIWCQPTECLRNDDSATHRHLIGSIENTEVYVERYDRLFEGKLLIGLPRVHITGECDLPSVAPMVTLLQLADMFRAEVSR